MHSAYLLLYYIIDAADFSLQTTTDMFPESSPSASTACINVQATQDTICEGNKSVTINIASATGPSVVTGGTPTVQITDDGK